MLPSPRNASITNGDELNTLCTQDNFSSEFGQDVDRRKRGWWLGIFFIVLVSFLWAGGSILTQHVDDIGFNHPFAFAYIANVVLSGCIPFHLLCALAGFVVNPRFRDAPACTNGCEQTYKVFNGHGDEEGDADDEGGDDDDDRRQGPEGRAPLRSHLFMFKIALSLSVIFFVAQWSYIYSLALTSVTSSTIIANGSSLFTYVFNVVARTESFTLRKTGGVGLVLLGTVLVALADREEDASGESLWGDALALLSAIAYGVYSVILALRAPSDDEVSMTLVFGYLGVINGVIFLPLLVALALAPGTQALEGLTLHVVMLIIIKAVFDNLLSDLLWARAILLTTATVATVGCSLTIPIAFASDFVLHRTVPKALAVLGAVFVIGGFFFVSERETAGTRACSSRPGNANGDDPHRYR